MLNKKLSPERSHDWEFYGKFFVIAILLVLIGLTYTETDEKTRSRYTQEDADADLKKVWEAICEDHKDDGDCP